MPICLKLYHELKDLAGVHELSSIGLALAEQRCL